MKFDKKCKLHRMTGPDGRYAMSQVRFEKGGPQGDCLVATNGRGIVVIPVTDTEGDTAGLIPGDAVAEATKHRTNKSTDAEIEANGSVRVQLKVGTRSFDRADSENEFPDTHRVFPECGVTHRVAVDASLLRDAASALGCDWVVLEIRAAGDPIVVRPFLHDGDDQDGRKAAIMPLSLKEQVKS